jgi:hypothetical protein
VTTTEGQLALQPRGTLLRPDMGTGPLEPLASVANTRSHAANTIGKVLAAALLAGAVVTSASPVVPKRDHELVAGARPVIPERDNELVTDVRPVVPKRNNEFGVCAGAPVQPFERRLSEQVRRFAFDGTMLEPFLRLWQSGDRPDLPMSPESVIVYAAPGKPYVVGYERQGCMIAFLAVTHQELWHWLRPSVGWLAEGPGSPVPWART